MARTILITGCSTGIGWYCALGMKARGWRVFATARRPGDLARLEAEGIESLFLDYADPASVSACAAEVASRTGGKLDMETKLRYKRNCAMGMKLLTEAVDSLFEMLGANGIYDSSEMQRLYRDQHAALGHFSFSADAQLAPWAQVALGGDFKSPTL